jgi:hypothetical protein
MTTPAKPRFHHRNFIVIYRGGVARALEACEFAFESASRLGDDLRDGYELEAEWGDGEELQRVCDNYENHIEDSVEELRDQLRKLSDILLGMLLEAMRLGKQSVAFPVVEVGECRSRCEKLTRKIQKFQNWLMDIPGLDPKEATLIEGDLGRLNTDLDTVAQHLSMTQIAESQFPQLDAGF